MTCILEEICFLFMENKMKPTASTEKMNEAQAVLWESLNEKQQELFTEYYNAEAEFISEREVLLFSRGFKMGAQIVLELLQVDLKE